MEPDDVKGGSDGGCSTAADVVHSPAGTWGMLEAPISGAHDCWGRREAAAFVVAAAELEEACILSRQTAEVLERKRSSLRRQKRCYSYWAASSVTEAGRSESCD